MRTCCLVPLHRSCAVVACVVITWIPVRVEGDSFRSPPSVATTVASPAWPCRLIVGDELRQSVDIAWEHSATFRRQCARLADTGTLVLLRRATSVQTSRPAQSRIGVSPSGITVARVLVRQDADTVEHIAHELEHVVEYLDKVNFGEKVGQHRAGVTHDGYETDRAIDAGRRAAREVRESRRSAECPGT